MKVEIDFEEAFNQYIAEAKRSCWAVNIGEVAEYITALLDITGSTYSDVVQVAFDALEKSVTIEAIKDGVRERYFAEEEDTL